MNFMNTIAYLENGMKVVVTNKSDSRNIDLFKKAKVVKVEDR